VSRPNDHGATRQRRAIGQGQPGDDVGHQ
jgi:hypothetical protein